MSKACTLALAALALTVVACGGKHESPTQPSPGPELGAAQLTVKVDGAESAAAIVGVSEVSFEASATGNGVSYEIQFGDGKSATTAKAVHVYEQSGTFTRHAHRHRRGWPAGDGVQDGRREAVRGHVVSSRL